MFPNLVREKDRSCLEKKRYEEIDQISGILCDEGKVHDQVNVTFISILLIGSIF